MVSIEYNQEGTCLQLTISVLKMPITLLLWIYSDAVADTVAVDLNAVSRGRQYDQLIALLLLLT